MQRLLAAYQEPQRKYHTLQHLAECLSLLEKYLSLAEHPGEVEVALWFHDAVYDVAGKENEAKSAAWAAEELTAAGVAEESVARISDLILATRHTALPHGGDQQLLVDVDLSILGAARARFIEYEAQVRAEYHWVPEPIFRQERKRILEGFLGRKQIYSTEAIRQALEAAARANLEYSVATLGG